MKIVVDIDGTLCEDTAGLDYENAPPKWDVIEAVRRHYLLGYHVTIFTARGMHRFGGDGSLCDQNLRGVTEAWLMKYLVPYHVLLFGKPSSDVYIDDKGMRPDEFSTRNP